MVKDLLLITHFLGLALSLGTGFSMLRLGASTRDMDPAKRLELMNRVIVLSKNGSIGLLLLLASGIAMFFEGGGMAMFRATGWPFHTKVTLVLVLIGLMGALQANIAKLRKAAGSPADAQVIAAKLPKIGMAMTTTGILIVIMAVLAFH